MCVSPCRERLVSEGCMYSCRLHLGDTKDEGLAPKGLRIEAQACGGAKDGFRFARSGADTLRKRGGPFLAASAMDLNSLPKSVLRSCETQLSCWIMSRLDNRSSR